ncbi:MAG TPA: AAA family ATPase, partial [Burkholderiales bacterium]|nr:AAA family ATPase [Burkholderiales bacterium]
MNITEISIGNYLGARSVEVTLRTPIALFCGANYAGKSSIQEAVRHALVGESARVGQKKEYARLISEGATTGFAEVACHGEKFSIALPSGKGVHSQNEFLPYVLDAQRFAHLDQNGRRQFLFGLMGIKIGRKDVEERMIARGCDDEKASSIAPLLRSGFDAAEKEAAAKARDAKASWKTATGGETWGKDKAESWAPKALDVDGEKAQTLHANAKKKCDELDSEIQTISQQIGTAKAIEQRIKANLQARSSLEETAGKFARIQDKLNRDEVDLKEWEAKLLTAESAASGKKSGLIHDLADSLNECLKMVIPFGEMDDHQKRTLKSANSSLETYTAQNGKIGSSHVDDELA